MSERTSTKPVKVGFVLLSSTRDPLPSTRITVLNMLSYLREAGFDPCIVFEQEQPKETPEVSHLARCILDEGVRIVFFQKVHGPSVQALARQLSASGVRSIFGVCDVVDAAMVEATDCTIAVTAYLRSLYPKALQSKIHVVHDGIENPQARKTAWSEHVGSRQHPLRAVLVTSAHLTNLPVLGRPPEWLEVVVVGRYPAAREGMRRLKEAYWAMRAQPLEQWRAYASFLLDRRIRCVPWDPVGVYQHLEQADIGIIPIETRDASEASPGAQRWQVKSENRLTMKMAVGLPVVATPIPSYEPLIEQGSNGFLARTPQDWWNSLEALRDPARRRAIGERARLSVSESYSMREQARRLISILRGLQPQASACPASSDACAAARQGRDASAECGRPAA